MPGGGGQSPPCVLAQLTTSNRDDPLNAVRAGTPPPSGPLPQTREDFVIRTRKRAFTDNVPMIISPTSYLGVEFFDQIGGIGTQRGLEEPLSILGSLVLTALMNICVFCPYYQA